MIGFFERKKVGFWCGAALEVATLVTVLAFILFYDRRTDFLSPPIDFWQSRYISFENGEWNGNEEVLQKDSDLIYGPFMHLDRGFYSVTVEYACSSTQAMEVYSYLQGNAVLKFEKELLPSDQVSKTYHFILLRDIDDAEVRVQYNGNGDVSIHNIYITNSSFFLKLLFFILLFAFALLDLILIESKDTSVCEFDSFLKYRYIWMSFAIILIMVYHSDIVFGNRALDDLKSFGYGGVDVF